MTGPFAFDTFDTLAAIFLGCLGLWFTCCLLSNADEDEDEGRTTLARPVPTTARDRLAYALTTTPPGVTREYLDHIARRPRRRTSHPAE